MFKPTAAKTPEEYIELIAEPRRKEIQTLHEFIQKTVPNQKPFILSGMIGYGAYHYRYATGREGDWALIALASQKNYISLYVCANDGTGYLAEQYTNDLPQADIGKSCIRFKKLANINLKVVEKLLLTAQKLGGMGKALA